ncbi:TetR/AcrR family transcriptional regulator [Bounagaea algeriensis]
MSTSTTAASATAKTRILEAVLRLVVRGGIAEASLRKVAEEAGINIGSVRHYFGSAESLMTAAAEEVGARMAQRLDEALPPGADAQPAGFEHPADSAGPIGLGDAAEPGNDAESGNGAAPGRPAGFGDAEVRRERLEAVCRAVLPLAESDRAELVVLVELITAARLRPEFRPIAVRMGEDLRAVLRQALRTAHVPDAEVEAERLHAVIGGLTFELVYPHGPADGDAALEVLRKHIAELVPA